VKGFYLAMATLAAHVLIIYLISNLTGLTGGTTRGLLVPPVKLGGVSFMTDKQQWYLIMPIAVILVYVIKNVMRTKFGRAFVAVRDNDIAAEVMGINVFLFKVIAFARCSFLAGVAGSLWAITRGIIHPDHFTLLDGIWYIAIVIVGGMGSIMGVIYGALFMEILSEMVLVLTPYISSMVPVITEQSTAAMTSFFFGLTIALFLIFEPRGINHTWEVLKIKYRLWPFPH
jgi:branched-chain amino acid transport system permease protein